MKAASRFLALAGLVLLPFGLVSYALTGVFDLWTAVHVAGGALLLVTGIVLNFAGFRRTMSLRGTRERARGLTGSVLFVAILAAVNVLAARHPWRYDATEKKIYTLSEHTIAVTRGLAEPVELLAFLGTGDPARKDLGDLLDRFAATSPRITWRFVDPEREPQLADQLGVRRKGVLAARTSDGASHGVVDTAGLGEEGIANLLLKVTRKGPKTLLVLTGHGEPSPDDLDDPDGLGALAGLLRNDGFDVRKLLLSAAAHVPEGTLAVLLVGPRKPLLPHELDELRTYLARGGRLLALLDPENDPAIGPLLVDYRVAAGDDLIVDQEEIPFLGARLGLDPIVEDFPSHPITRNFKERIVLFEARSIDARSEGGIRGADAKVIARSRDTSWAAADYRAILSTGRVDRSPKDRPGPIPVAVAAEAPAGGGTAAAKGADATVPAARLVVIGDSDLARNGHLGDYFNAEFLLDAVQWLAGREDLVAERPKGFRPSRLDMSEADYRTLFRLGVLFLPEAILIVGLGVWWRRRSL